MPGDKNSTAGLIQELKETKRRFSLALTAADAGAWEWNIATNQTYWSDENYRVLGLPVGSGLATYEQWFSCVHPEDRAFAQERVESAVLSRGDLDFEYRAVWPDGTVRWIRDVGKMMLDDEGNPIGMFGIQMDITEKRELEATLQRSQRMEALGEIAAAIAHDFNNFLTVIMGHAELLNDDLQPAGGLKEMTAEILHSADRAAQLTRQLLAFGRPQTLRTEVVDLQQVLRGIELLARPILGEGIDFVMVLRHGTLPVRVDPGQLEQVFLNLLVNAKDAMPVGGALRLTAEIEALGPDRAGSLLSLSAGSYVVVFVQDTGQGMDQETLDRIFDPFFSTKPSGRGSGLGLASAFGIVKQVDGLITVESAVGQGSIFKVYLPLAQRVEAIEEAVTRPAVAVEAGKAVMAVEDNAAILRLVTRVLAGGGYEVLTASSAEDALEFLAGRRKPFDLLLTDVILAGMTGIELAKRVRQFHPSTSVLFTSGYSGEAFQPENLPGVPPSFLPKPFSGQQLLEKVSESLATVQIRNND